MKQRDIMFKIGLALQLLLIPVTFLWHFSQEANYYNWILVVGFALVISFFFWPQTLLGRVKRLRAIRLQLISVVIMLGLSWAGWAYFHNFSRTNCTPSFSLQRGADQSTPVQPGRRGENCNFNPSANQSLSATVYTVHWEGVFDRPWVMLLGPGISPFSAAILTAAFLSLPLANFYRYKLDHKRIQGLKKEDLFV